MAERTALFLINGALQGVSTSDELLSGGLVVEERASDPTPQADRIILYSKDVGGRSEVFFRASDGTISQITTTEGNISGWTDDGSLIRLTNPANSVGIGATTFSSAVKLHIVGNDALNSFIFFDESSNVSSDRVALVGRRARGTNASKLAVAGGDIVLDYLAQAYDGTDYRSMASIQSRVESFVGVDDLSGRLVFATRPTGIAAMNVERMIITGPGHLLFGASAFLGTELVRFDRSLASPTIFMVSNTSAASGASASIAVRNDIAATGMGITGSGGPVGIIPANTGFIRTDSGITGGLIIDTGAAAPIAFYTGDTERARFTSVGDLVLGDSVSTGFRLRIVNDSATPVGIRRSSTGAVNILALENLVAFANGTGSQIAWNALNSASVNFTFAQISATVVDTTAGLEYGRFNFILDNAGVANTVYDINETSGYHRWLMGGSDLMRLLSTGELLINKTTSTSANAKIQVEASTNIPVQVQVETTSTGTLAVALTRFRNTAGIADVGITSTGFTPVGGVDANELFMTSNSTLAGIKLSAQGSTYIRFATSSTTRYEVQSDGRLQMSANYSIVPDTDDNGTIGTDNTETGGDPLTIGNRRWHLIRGNIVKSGDYRFENGWTLTENYEGAGGIKLLRPDKSIAAHWE